MQRRWAPQGALGSCYATLVRAVSPFPVLWIVLLTARAGPLDALSTSALTHIILDISFRDVKKRSLLDIPETRDEVFRTVLGAPKVFNGLRQGTIQLVLL